MESNTSSVILDVLPFGRLSYLPEEKVWFGYANNISPDSLVELSISVGDCRESLTRKIALVHAFASAYPVTMELLLQHVFHKYECSKWERPQDALKQMYHLASVALKDDTGIWWLVLAPGVNVPAIYDQYLRFTMDGHRVTWTNF